MKKYVLIWVLLLSILSGMVSSENLENKTQNILLSTNLEKNYYLNIIFDHLFTLDKQVDCSEKDQVTVLYNVSKNNHLVKEEIFIRDLNSCTKVSASTGDFTPFETGNYTLCGVILNSTVTENNSFYHRICTPFEVLDTSSIFCDTQLRLETNKTIFYQNGQSIEFKPELNNKSFPFVIEYWIEDLFGEIVKPKINTTNTNQKSWKTNIQEQDRVLFLRATLYSHCNDVNLSDNFVKEMFIVTKNEAAAISSSAEEISPMNSTLNITEVSPETVPFGEVLNAEIEMYKGATDKYSVSLWVEKSGKIISEKTKVHLKNKNTLYKFTLPVQIEPNCNEKIKEGTAQLVVEGLGLHAEKEFTLEGINEDLCQDKNSAETAAETKPKNNFEIIDLPAIIYPGEALPVKLKIQNDKGADFAVWGYLFRGNKCYSCSSTERDGNKISFSVDKDETTIEELQIKVDQEILEGEYTVMVKYKKDDQKTENSITQKINVKEPAEANSADQTLPLLSQAENFGSPPVSKKITAEGLPNYEGIMVYESTAERSKNLISWVLFISFGLLSLVLTLKKKQ